MKAPAPKPHGEEPPGGRPRRHPLFDQVDPLLVEAAGEVDRTLLHWMLSLSPRERLDACSRATAALARFQRVPPEAG